MNRFDHLFLVKRPSQSASPSSPIIEFRTTIISTRAQGSKVEGNEFASSWVVEPIRKKPGRPFPERVSVGRASNCDIAIRATYISKLHAYFLLESGQPLRLVDNKSANGTWVDSRRLEDPTPMRVGPGSRVCFGALTLTLFDARQFYELLNST